MAQSASSSLGVPGLNIRGIFFGILVVALIAALFFIPEIIDFQRSSRGSTTAAPAEVSTKGRASTSIFSSSEDSPLGKLKNLINGGFSEQLRMKRVVERGDSATGYTPGGKVQPVSWQDIRAKDSKKQLQTAEAEVNEIARAIPINRLQSRYALVTLGNGLRDVYTGNADQALSADEAIRYLEYLHSNVSRSMLQENVDRIHFERWQRVSFGPTLAMYSRELDRQFVPFNPQLTLTQVSVTQKKRKNRFEPVASPLVEAKGYVVGTDINKIEIWGTGTQIKSIKLRKPDARGLVSFTTGRLEAKGLLTFRVVSKDGQKFEKIYQFAPRFKIFPYKKGKYLIPAAVNDADTSVDRFFTRGYSGTDSSGFFGGPLIGKF